MVRPKGLEPSREISHNHLKVARLPISPWPHIANKAVLTNKSQIKINQVLFANGEKIFNIIPIPPSSADFPSLFGRTFPAKIRESSAISQLKNGFSPLFYIHTTGIIEYSKKSLAAFLQTRLLLFIGGYDNW